MAAVIVIVPITPAISLDGTIKSPQIAPECTPLAKDFFKIRPHDLIRRRKQQIYLFFFFPFGVDVAIICSNHLQIVQMLETLKDTDY